MDEAPAEKWNGRFKAQFQLNKKWMIGTAAGLIGDKKLALTFLA